LPFVPFEIKGWKAKTPNVMPLQETKVLDVTKSSCLPDNSFPETRPLLARSYNWPQPVDEFPLTPTEDPDEFDFSILDEIFEVEC
jgi:hypothetical protein